MGGWRMDDGKRLLVGWQRRIGIVGLLSLVVVLGGSTGMRAALARAPRPSSAAPLPASHRRTLAQAAKARRGAVPATCGSSLGVVGQPTQQAKLTASDGATGDAFGTPVAIYGNVAVVGAPFRDSPPRTNNGGAYVYVR